MKEERKRILKMVEKGTITVEEAIMLIEKLEEEYNGKNKSHSHASHHHTTAKIFTDLEKKDSFYDEDEFTKDAKKQYTSSQSFQQTKNKFFDFVDQAVKKIKDIDFDLQWIKGIEISHIFQHTDAQISEVEIDIPYGSLEIIPWDEKDIRLECQAKVYKVDDQDEARNVFLKSSVFSVKDGKLRFVSQPKILKVDTVAYIPKQQYESIWVKLMNGSIKTESILANKTILKSVNGRIVVDGIRGKHLDAESTNGSVSLNSCFLEALEAESINGKLTAIGEFNKVDMQCLNGSVTCDVKNSDVNTVRLKAGTGSIHLTLPDDIAAQGELKSSLGSVSVNLDADIQAEKSEVLQKQVTFLTAKSGEPKAYIFAETKTGSVTVDGKKKEGITLEK
ncbi:DUF4097 and DUF4098 domain-containing protein YvlB [Bacillus oleivorans]|uniref:DUF4097 and DUF4098 domain-containing protein YvlB n=1 Tax=Bacillus oleivorans TaxID=1448271 RepID=A0A285CZY1_9BACI|nr:DUF4097 domain-containing protein [Bacillus oleivorans]SNX72628.1 DUF4097 and DUF4098 domain-containing protein YvlB [Bacillus oleivorans]